MPRLGGGGRGAGPGLSVEHLLLNALSSAHHGAMLDGFADLEAHVAALAPPVLNALDVHEQLRDPLPTGCPGVDALLEGGMLEGCVLEVTGESSAGKTQLCHMAAATTALGGRAVAYVDTTNSFSAPRLAQMLVGMQGPAQDVQAHAALARVHVHTAHTIHDLAAVLDALALQLAAHQGAGADGAVGAGGAAAAHTRHTAGPGDGTAAPAPPVPPPQPPPPALIIVDSLSAVVGPVLGGAHFNQGQALLACVARSLKHMAHAFRVAVLVTTHVVAGRGPGEGRGNLVPAMGEAWRNQAHTRLQLHLGQQGAPDAPRQAILAKSSTRAVGDAVWFAISPSGLQCV